MTNDYEAAIIKLVERARLIYQSHWSPTQARKDCELVASTLEKAERLLTSTPQAAAIEDRHNRRGEPDTFAGPDGWPEKEPEQYWPSYKSIQFSIRCLAASARIEADALPDPREKIALHHAAMGVLYLRQWHDMKPFTDYVNCEPVIELERIATMAGFPRSREACRSALRKATDMFDEKFRLPEFGYLFSR